MSNKSKDPSVRAIEVLLLRKEPRRGTVVAAREAHVARAELDPAAVEVEERRAAEPAISVWRVLVPGAVDVQLLPLNKPLGMRQEHAPRDERPEAELVGVADDLAHPSHGPTPMGQAELCRDQQKVALLLFADHLERDGRPLGEPKVLRAKCAPLVEVAGLADQVEDLLDSLVVVLADLFELRDGEPPLGSLRSSSQFLGTGQYRSSIKAREVFGQCHELFADRLHGVPLRIAVVGLHLFVGEERRGGNHQTAFTPSSEAVPQTKHHILGSVGAVDVLLLHFVSCDSAFDGRPETGLNDTRKLSVLGWARGVTMCLL